MPRTNTGSIAQVPLNSDVLCDEQCRLCKPGRKNATVWIFSQVIKTNVTISHRIYTGCILIVCVMCLEARMDWVSFLHSLFPVHVGFTFKTFYFSLPVSFLVFHSVTLKCFDFSNALPIYLIILTLLLFFCEISMSKEFNLHCESMSLRCENGHLNRW